MVLAALQLGVLTSLIETLQILQNYQPRPGATYTTDADYFHHVIESWKVRDPLRRVADPERWPVDFEEHLTREHAKKLFAKIDPDPIAAASIAQVHAATLKDGTDVVVKIRRPRVEKQFLRDLRLLRVTAWLAVSRESPSAAATGPPDGPWDSAPRPPRSSPRRNAPLEFRRGVEEVAEFQEVTVEEPDRSDDAARAAAEGQAAPGGQRLGRGVHSVITARCGRCDGRLGGASTTDRYQANQA